MHNLNMHVPYELTVVCINSKLCAVIEQPNPCTIMILQVGGFLFYFSALVLEIF